MLHCAITGAEFWKAQVTFRSKHCKETDDIFTIIDSALERETKAMERLFDEVP